MMKIDNYKEYEIVLENDKKEVLNYTEPQISAIKKTGTKVEFDNIFSFFYLYTIFFTQIVSY